MKSLLLRTLISTWGSSKVVASIPNASILPTPPMGFNNWARFQCELNETLFTSTAEAMVSKGLLAAGYNRLNMDDCWMQTSRDQNGSLQWNTTLFPHGIPWLANYVNSLGFHLGIYGDAGETTCGGYPGSLDHEAQDASTFASWGVDYLKLDGCNLEARPGQTLEQRYEEVYGRWHEIFSSMNPTLAFSESAPAYFSGGTDFPPQANLSDWYRVLSWSSQYGELARHSKDIDVYGYYEPAEYWKSVMTNYEYETRIARFQAPGFYNDPDFLIADWPWLSLDEKKSQFALWASFSAPLIISADVPNLSQEEVEYLTNKDIIAIDQDPLGLQATFVRRDENFDVLSKDLANGDRLLTILNRGPVSSNVSVTTKDLGLETGPMYVIKDLWSRVSHDLHETFSITISSHATAIFRISNVIERAAPTGIIYTSASQQCLTSIESGSLKFENCTGTESQLWRTHVATIGHASIVESSATGLCLSARAVDRLDAQSPDDPKSTSMAQRSNLVLHACSDDDLDQHWLYHVSGNLQSGNSRLCLTQNGAVASGAKCSDQLDNQAFELPSGTFVIR